MITEYHSKYYAYELSRQGGLGVAPLSLEAVAEDESSGN